MRSFLPDRESNLRPAAIRENFPKGDRGPIHAGTDKDATGSQLTRQYPALPDHSEPGQNSVKTPLNNPDRIVQRSCTKCGEKNCKCGKKKSPPKKKSKGRDKKEEPRSKGTKRLLVNAGDVADFAVGDEITFSLERVNRRIGLGPGIYSGKITGINFAQEGAKNINYTIRIPSESESVEVIVPDYFLLNTEGKEKKKNSKKAKTDDSGDDLVVHDMPFFNPTSFFDPIMENPLPFLPLLRQGGSVDRGTVRQIPNPLGLTIPEGEESSRMISWQDDTYSMLASQTLIAGESTGMEIFRRQKESGEQQDTLGGDFTGLLEEEKEDYDVLSDNLYFKNTSEAKRGVKVDEKRKKIHSEANLVNSPEWILAKAKAIKTINFIFSGIIGSDWAERIEKGDPESEEMIETFSALIGPQVQEVIGILLNRASCKLPKSKSGFALGCSNELSIALEAFWEEIDETFGKRTGFLIRQFGIVMPELASAGRYKKGTDFPKLQKAGWQPTVIPQYGFKDEDFLGVTTSQKNYFDEIDPGLLLPFFLDEFEERDPKTLRKKAPFKVESQSEEKEHRKEMPFLLKHPGAFQQPSKEGEAPFFEKAMMAWKKGGEEYEREKEIRKKTLGSLYITAAGPNYENYELSPQQRERLGNLNLRTLPTIPDGDCAYSSVDESLNLGTSAGGLRERAAKWVNDNREKLKAGEYFKQIFDDEEIDALIKEILTPFGFTGLYADLAISVLAELTQSEIHVMGSSGVPQLHWKPKDAVKKILLVHVDHGIPHFYGTRNL